MLQSCIDGTSSSWHFSGSLTESDKAVPSVLLTVITMLLEGPGEASHVSSEAALSVSQLVMFNAIKRTVEGILLWIPLRYQ